MHPLEVLTLICVWGFEDRFWIRDKKKEKKRASKSVLPAKLKQEETVVF